MGTTASQPEQATQPQAQLASQTMVVAAARRQEPLQPGLARGVANMLANHWVDIIEVANDQGIHTDLGQANRQPDGRWGLGIDKPTLHDVVVALTPELGNVETVLGGWLRQLPEYLRWHSPADADSVRLFLDEPAGAAATRALMAATRGLTLVLEALQHAWVDPWGALADNQRMALAMIADGSIDPGIHVWLRTLTFLGYFTPGSIAAHNRRCPDDYCIDPFDTVARDGTFFIVPHGPGGWRPTPSTDEWLDRTKFVAVGRDAMRALAAPYLQMR